MLRQSSEGVKAKLISDVLRGGGRIRLRVLGMSMLPSLWPGDHAIVESRASEEIRCGDIVLFQTGNAFVMHRFIAVRDDDRLMTRGDAMPQADPSIHESALLGRVTQIERNGKMVTPRRGTGVAMKTLAWALCHSARCRSLALKIHSLRTRKAADYFSHPLQLRSNPRSRPHYRRHPTIQW